MKNIYADILKLNSGTKLDNLFSFISCAEIEVTREEAAHMETKRKCILVTNFFGENDEGQINQINSVLNDFMSYFTASKNALSKKLKVKI